MAKLLAVFDFDKTVISGNSDVIIAKLLPKEVLGTAEMKALRPSWTAYMDEIFRLLPQNGVDKSAVTKICETFEPTEGMLDLFQYLGSKNAEIIILSDANHFMISTWLNHNLPHVKVDRIITNPAQWEGDVLHVKPYENQTTCKECPNNLCKGSVLQCIVKSNHYDFVMYIGDGKNDWCPSEKLKTGDWVFARKNHTLEELIKEKPITAQFYIWETAHEIQQKIKDQF